MHLARAGQSFIEAREEYLCRDAREITGHSPLELARILASTDERYWIYRGWT
jgi:hypothetical protein